MDSLAGTIAAIGGIVNNRLDTAVAMLALASMLGCGGGVGEPDADAGEPDAFSGPTCFPPLEPDPTLFEKQVLLAPGEPSATTNVRVADLRGDGSMQILVADAGGDSVVLVEACGAMCQETTLGTNLGLPARTHVVDADGDGDRDVIVASVGALQTTDDKVGRVTLLDNDGSFGFTPTVLLADIGRTACAESADFDGDDDVDIVVCEFGNSEGNLLWLERLPAGDYTTHVLDPRPGAIHAFPFDADGDGDIDIAALVSQLSEEVMLYRNDGAGAFSAEVLFSAGTTNFGSSGIELVDLDQDGDTDILQTNGDLFDNDWLDVEDLCGHYGLAWLDNDGSGNFTRKTISNYFASFSARALDVDLDGDLDIVVSSLQDLSVVPPIEPVGLLWLENDGAQGFSRRASLATPNSVVSIDAVDFDGDGDVDIVAGSILPDGDRLAVFRNLTIE